MTEHVNNLLTRALMKANFLYPSILLLRTYQLKVMER